jgi:hypothetical protein
MMMDLDKFFEEKEIPYTSWEIEHDGQIHFIDSDFVIEAILSTKGTERSQIAGQLFALDFKNANIVDYLHYLSKQMIVNR